MATKFITVSIEIMHDKNLNQSQKFILAEIEQLSQLDNGCYASNKHFSDLIGITKENVSRNINDLQKMGYINVDIVKGTRNHTRIITFTTLVRPPYQNSKTPLSKQQETKENIQVNKTNNKTVKEKNKSLINQIAEKRIESQGLVNQHALDEWLKYKKYKNIQGVTKTINFLSGYDFSTQQQIVDTSIMNNYKGLFEPKQKRSNTQSFKQQDEQQAKEKAVNINRLLNAGFNPFKQSDWDKLSEHEAKLMKDYQDGVIDVQLTNRN